MYGDRGFKFDSQVAFSASDYKKLVTESNESRLNSKHMDEFIKAFSSEFNLMLFGLDIVISDSGKHLIIDCNYFSSYTEFDERLLARKFDELYEFAQTRDFRKSYTQKETVEV